MRSSYRREDVTLLLKDITGLVDPQPASEREPLIQKGVHYSEMLPLEYRPTGPYMEAYQRALDLYADSTAEAVAFAAQRIYGEKGPGLILVSLARAGIPAGILIKHFMKETFDYDPPHYAISIIRGRGIDHNALQYILSRHEPHALQFIDGWTGKGAIARELASALAPYPGVSPNLAVLSDPANLTHRCV